MITLYSHKRAPNGWKVAIVLEELGLKYETKLLEFGAEEPGIKGPEHLKLNPNGRIPTIIDHDNGDFVLWESNSIIKYLIETYDKENKLQFPRGTKEYFLVDQWMTFQVSGQGPYYGQVTWFKLMHPENVPSALERYRKEVIRVLSVLDGVLANQKFLVGNRLTAADFVFFPWNDLIFNPPNMLDDSPYRAEVENFPNFLRWHETIKQHPSVKKAYEDRAAVMS